MATQEKKENKTKVLVNVYEPLITLMKHKCDAACLKRDLYLDKALHRETELLREEVLMPNSDRAKSYIADNLKRLRLKPLNLLLSTETVDLMNEVCKEKNIPRDVFINRVFLLMIASDTVIDSLFYRVIHKNHFSENRSEEESQRSWESSRDESASGSLSWYGVGLGDVNILDKIEELISFQPLGTLRGVFLDYSDWTNLYSYVFEKNALSLLPNEYAFLKTDNALGFNTFMTDEEISQQEALVNAMEKKLALDKLLAFTKKEKQARAVKIKSVGEAQ